MLSRRCLRRSFHHSRRQVGQVSVCTFMLVLIWPGLLWLGGRNEEEEQPVGETAGLCLSGLVGFGTVLMSPWFAVIFIVLTS